jgi:uncharacterized cupredoxin-like copper-binding protein
MTPRAVLLSFIALATLAACSTKSSKDTVAVTATDSACTPAKTELPAGKVTFAVTNKGGKVTELYVYGPGDRVIGEVENVGPGATRKLSANLTAGTYELACKPGQTGSGIRTKITVTGSGGAQGGAAPVASREVEVHAVDYAFNFNDPAIKAGETIKFELINDGTKKHEFEVFGPDGKVVGEVEAVDPGAKDSATLEFAKAGTYRYECHIDDHHERGMHGELRVV